MTVHFQINTTQAGEAGALLDADRAADRSPCGLFLLEPYADFG